MLIILLLLFLVFPCQIFAAPTISIVDFPESIVAGNIFNVTFSVSNATAGLTYHYKVVGDGNSEILTQPNTSCASNYDTCENINIASDSASIATASAKMNMVSGIYNLKIRIAQSDKHTSTYNSDIVSVTSILPSPTPTIAPTNTPVPTSTPFPTNTPTPTSTPTSTPTKAPTPTPTEAPTPTITPTETIVPFLTSTEEPSPLDLSDQNTPTENLTSTSSSVLGATKSNSKNYLPLIFICLGALFLLTPLIIARIKHEN